MPSDSPARFWTLLDVVLPVFYLLPVRDSIGLLMVRRNDCLNRATVGILTTIQTCSTLYDLSNDRKRCVILIERARRDRNLPSSDYRGLEDCTILELKSALRRLLAAEGIWNSSFAVPRRVQRTSLQLGDVIDCSLSGTPLVLVRNPANRTLRCVNVETGVFSSAVHLGLQVRCFSSIQSTYNGGMVAYVSVDAPHFESDALSR
jgi:hypothetical protein